MCDPPPAGVGPPCGAEIVCIRYWPLASFGPFVSLLLFENVYASVKKPEPPKVNHCSIVALPLDGRMLGGSERYPPAVLGPLNAALFNCNWPPETVATLTSV